MADGDLFGFDEQSVRRIGDVVQYVEHNPRYPLRQRKYGGPPPPGVLLFCVLEDFTSDPDCPEFMVGDCKLLSDVATTTDCACMSAGDTRTVYAIKDLLTAGFGKPLRGDRIYAFQRGSRIEASDVIRRLGMCVAPCLQITFPEDDLNDYDRFLDHPILIRQVPGSPRWHNDASIKYFRDPACDVEPFANPLDVDIDVHPDPDNPGYWLLVIQATGASGGGDNTLGYIAIYSGQFPACCDSCSVTWSLVSCRDFLASGTQDCVCAHPPQATLTVGCSGTDSRVKGPCCYWDGTKYVCADGVTEDLCNTLHVSRDGDAPCWNQALGGSPTCSEYGAGTGGCANCVTPSSSSSSGGSSSSSSSSGSPSSSSSSSSSCTGTCNDWTWLSGAWVPPPGSGDCNCTCPGPDFDGTEDGERYTPICTSA